MLSEGGLRFACLSTDGAAKLRQRYGLACVIGSAHERIPRRLAHKPSSSTIKDTRPTDQVQLLMLVRFRTHSMCREEIYGCTYTGNSATSN